MGPIFKKGVVCRSGFRVGERIIYPAHGVGQIIGFEDLEVCGSVVELFVISFEKDKMTLRVPTAKAATVGMRKLSEMPVVQKAMAIIETRARVKRIMWSRRAQEYDAKINSGDLIAVAEVVRDLYRFDNQADQSYSERQLYEAAMERMSSEIAAVMKLPQEEMVMRIEDLLAKVAAGAVNAIVSESSPQAQIEASQEIAGAEVCDEQAA